MADIDRIVKATILLRTAPVAEKGFSDLLIIGTHNFTAERVTSVSSDTELLDKGVLETDVLYKAVQQAFAQEPGVSTVYIGRRTPTNAAVTLAAPEGTAGEVYYVTAQYFENKQLKSETFSYTTVGNGTDDTATKVAALLAPLINANSALTATATLNRIAITMAGDTPAVTETSTKITSSFDAAVESITVAAAACRRYNDVFYGVAATTRDVTEQLQLADWIESNDKLGGFATSDVNAYVASSETDLLARMQNKNYFRSFGLYSDMVGAGGEYPEIAWMSRKFRTQPGGETWANTTLSGVSSTNIDEGQYLAIVGKNGNTFEPFRTLAVTQNGKVAGGEWIDVIRFRDWLLERIRVDGFQVFVDNRIGFTDAGLATIHNALRKSLVTGRDVGGIAPEEVDADTKRIIPSFTTVIPAASSFSAQQKATRKATGIKFTARLTGAIHATEISGTLAYEL